MSIFCNLIDQWYSIRIFNHLSLDTYPHLIIILDNNKVYYTKKMKNIKLQYRESLQHEFTIRPKSIIFSLDNIEHSIDISDIQSIAIDDYRNTMVSRYIFIVLNNILKQTSLTSIKITTSDWTYYIAVSKISNDETLAKIYLYDDYNEEYSLELLNNKIIFVGRDINDEVVDIDFTI